MIHIRVLNNWIPRIMYSAKPRPKITLKTLLPTIIGLVVFLFYILLFNVNISEVLLIAKSEDLSIYSVAVVVSILEMFFDAVSWRALLGNLKVKISVVRSFLYTLYGTFIDALIPFEGISADLVRIYLVNQEQNGSSGKVVASVVIRRIIMIGIDDLVLITGVTFLFRTTQLTPLVSNLILLFTVALTIVIAFLLLVSWKNDWSTRIINSLVRIGEFLGGTKWKQKLEKIKVDALDIAKTFHNSIKESTHNKLQLIVPTLALVFKWISSISVPYLVFLSLGLQVSWAVIFITSSIVVAVTSIPVGIPEVGLPEITMTTIYIWMGVPAKIGATATILIRILTFWLRLVIGFIAQQWIEFITHPRLKMQNQ